MWLVRVACRRPGARSDAEVVLVLVPLPGMGNGPCRPIRAAAVQVVDRVVEVDRPIPVVEQVLVSQHGRAWPQALVELDAGRLYDRDLPALADALGQVLTALDRRPGWRRQQGR